MPRENGFDKFCDVKRTMESLISIMERVRPQLLMLDESAAFQKDMVM